ncbi:hypothetical protein ACYJW8_02210 [Frateuria aurantia]
MKRYMLLLAVLLGGPSFAGLRSLPALDRCLMSNVPGWRRWNPDDGLPWLPDGTH